MSDPTVNGIDLSMLNYTTQVPYNGTIPTGGNSLTTDLNVFYNVCEHFQQTSCLKSGVGVCASAWRVLTDGVYNLGW